MYPDVTPVNKNCGSTRHFWYLRNVSELCGDLTSSNCTLCMELDSKIIQYGQLNLCNGLEIGLPSNSHHIPASPILTNLNWRIEEAYPPNARPC